MKRFACALAAVALVCACDKDAGKDNAATPEHDPADVEARADTVYKAYREMFDNLPDASAAPVSCPDDKIKTWTGEEKQRQITFLAYQSLRYTLEEPWLGTNSLVRFMTNSKLRYSPRPKFDLSKKRNIKQLMRMWNFVEYIGVVVPIAERQAQASTAFTGDAGAFEGQLVVYRSGDAQPICHTTFSVKGSGGASYLHRADDNSNDRKSKAQHALKRALCGDISAEIKTQVGRISEALKPSFIDCNAV